MWSWQKPKKSTSSLSPTMRSTLAFTTHTSAMTTLIQATSTWIVKSGAASSPRWIRSMQSYHHDLKTSSSAPTAVSWKPSYQCVWDACGRLRSRLKNRRKFKKTTTTHTTRRCTSAHTAATTATGWKADVTATSITAESASRATSARPVAASLSSLYKTDYKTREPSFISWTLNEQHVFL